MIFTRGVLSIPACDVYVRLETAGAKFGGEFEQLARYTTRYQESDLHLAFILRNLLTTSPYTASFSVQPTSLLLLY